METSVETSAKGHGGAPALGEEHERSWTIGEMAREFKVSLRTLRFYEDRGLLRPYRKGTSRLYSPRERLHLQMILKGKQLGFTLSEIREILARDDGAVELNLAPDQIVAQIRHIERQLTTLEKALAELRLAQERAQAAALRTA